MKIRRLYDLHKAKKAYAKDQTEKFLEQYEKDPKTIMLRQWLEEFGIKFPECESCAFCQITGERTKAPKLRTTCEVSLKSCELMPRPCKYRKEKQK